MSAFAQPTYHQYNPYQDLAMQQELQRRRQIEAYLRRQQQVEEMERRQREYEAAVRRAEYERRRQAELQRRRQTQQARTRHSMYDGGLEALFDALYGAQGRRQEECQTSTPLWRSPKPTPELESMHASTHAPVPAPSPTPSPVAVDAEPTPNTEPKSEPEPEQEEPQADTASSHAAIQSILASFATLQSEFTFPSQLDFLPDSSPTLAYTPNNAPLHGYEHALTGLLTKLDGVESYGDGDVRRARKEAVKAIEKELERLDGMKADRWRG
ncbi:hypothetical protein BN14_05096 [Rhizoctonia solani AG-1 IB]|uniref:BAG domain-containing protein n=1 Tax=Thanatephorus cucumeris (strain AG1-IB / isolate 7/3/14) TaxID=1108050 RepID=M5C598_THACB|nr:hypothetical protein BN14_05096 [Rhizoctonia solani AG-1 IB]